MGNREIKITLMQTACWKTGNRAGLQGGRVGCGGLSLCLSLCLSVCLSAEGCREEGGCHTGAVWGETPSSPVFAGPHQTPEAEAARL